MAKKESGEDILRAIMEKGGQGPKGAAALQRAAEELAKAAQAIEQQPEIKETLVSTLENDIPTAEADEPVQVGESPRKKFAKKLGKAALKKMFPTTYSGVEALRKLWKESNDKEQAEKKRDTAEKKRKYEEIIDNLKDANDSLREMVSLQQETSSILSGVAEALAKNNKGGGGLLGNLLGGGKTIGSSLLRSISGIGGIMAGTALLGGAAKLFLGNNENKAPATGETGSAPPPAPPLSTTSDTIPASSTTPSSGGGGTTPPAGGNVSIAESKESAAVKEAKTKQTKAEDILKIKADQIRFNSDKLTFDVETFSIESKQEQQQSQQQQQQPQTPQQQAQQQQAPNIVNNPNANKPTLSPEEAGSRNAPGTTAPRNAPMSSGITGGPAAAGPPGLYRPQYKLSEADLNDDVLNTIAGEARLKDPKSVDAVINNMFNRLGAKGYGPSGNLQQVARAPGQYEGYRIASEKEKEMLRERIKAIASGSVEDITHGADQYRAASYVYGAGAGKTFANLAASQGNLNLGGNIYARTKNAPVGPYAAYATLGIQPPPDVLARAKQEQQQQAKTEAKTQAESETKPPVTPAANTAPTAPASGSRLSQYKGEFGSWEPNGQGGVKFVKATDLQTYKGEQGRWEKNDTGGAKFVPAKAGDIISSPNQMVDKAPAKPAAGITPASGGQFEEKGYFDVTGKTPNPPTPKANKDSNAKPHPRRVESHSPQPSDPGGNLVFRIAALLPYLAIAAVTGEQRAAHSIMQNRRRRY